MSAVARVLAWVLTGLLVAGIAVAADVEAAAAQEMEEQCIKWDISGRCVVTGLVPVGNSPAPTPGSGGPSRPAGPRPNCYWRTIPPIPGIERIIGEPVGLTNPVLQGYACDDNSHVPSPAIGLPVGFRWVEGGAAPEPPPPGVIAAALLVEVQAQMQAPQVASDPAVGTASIVRTPVFVEVTNWQGTITDSECVLGVCVTITAEPTLTFDPGEPGSSPVVCPPPGSRYDPNGPSPEAQAVGACAHAYSQRTGVEGRPGAWEGSVTTTWVISWTSNTGPSGSFPNMTFSTAVARPVSEVQAIVSEAD